MESSNKLLGSKHSSLRQRMKEKQFPKRFHAVVEEEEFHHNNHGQDYNANTTIDPLMNVATTIATVVSMDEDGPTPRSKPQSHFYPATHTQGLTDETQKQHASVQSHQTSIVANVSDSTNSISNSDSYNRQPFQNETTLIGQDYLSSDDDEDDNVNEGSLPLEAYNMDAMNDILKDLGESFLNASLLEDQSPSKEQYQFSSNDTNNCATSDDQTKSASITDLDVISELGFDHQSKDLHDSTQRSLDNHIYPFPSGEDSIQQVMDSSLLQVSLTSEASSTPSPASKPKEWQAYKSRNQHLKDRNASLVKEIRFSEQSCVELSHDKYRLQCELGRYTQMLEDEFASKKQLLHKLEQVLQAKEALHQELEEEKKKNHELLTMKQLEEEHNKPRRMDDTLAVAAAAEQHRHETMKLMEQIAEARLSNDEIQHELNQERSTKDKLKNALQEALLQIEVWNKNSLEQKTTMEDESALRSRISELESKLHQTEHELHEQHEQARQLDHEDRTSATKDTTHLHLRMEELEAQNSHLRRQISVQMDEPDGLLPTRLERRKPDAPNDRGRKPKHDSSSEGSNEDHESFVNQQHEIIADLFTKLESAEQEFSEYKKQEEERLDSACQRLKQQHETEIKNQIHTLETEKSRLQEELACQLHLTAGLRAWNDDCVVEWNQENQRLQHELLRERDEMAQIMDQLTALQKEHSRVVLSDMSLRTSLSDVKERLAHVMDQELVVSQRRCHSLESELRQQEQSFHKQLDAERRILQDDFLEQVSNATNRISNQASTVEAKLLQHVEICQNRILKLAATVKTLHSINKKLHFPSHPVNVKSTNSHDGTNVAVVHDDNASMEMPNVSVLNATFCRNGREPEDETMLHEMEEARLLSNDHEEEREGVVFMSELAGVGRGSMNGGDYWINTIMDVSHLDDTAVEEVKKLQNSLAEAQEQLTCQLAIVDALEQQIDELNEGRRLDHVQIRELRQTISNSECKVNNLQIKLDKAERFIALNVDTQEQQHFVAMQRVHEEMKQLENSMTSKDTTISKLQVQLEAAHQHWADKEHHYQTSIVELETIISRLQTAEKSQNEELNSMRHSIAENETELSKYEVKLEAAQESHDQVMHDLKNSISVLETRIETLQRDQETQRDESSNFRNLIAENEATIADLQDKLHTAEVSRNQTQQMESELHDAQAEIDHLRTAYLACNDRLAAAFDAMASNEDLIGRFKESSDEAIKTSSEAAEIVRNQNQSLTSRVALLEKELERTRKELVARETEVAKLTLTKAEIEGTLQETSRALLELTHERDASQCKLLECESKLIHITTERYAIERENNQAATEKQLELEAKVRHVTALELAKNNLSQELDSVMDNLMRTSKERDTLKMDLQVTVEKFDHAKNQLTGIKDELKTLQATHDKAIHQHADVIAQLRNSDSIHTDTVKELEEKLAFSHSELDCTRGKYLDLNDRIASLSDEKVQSNLTIESLTESLASAEADLVELYHKYDKQTKELESVLSNLSRVSEEALDDKDRLRKLQSQMEHTLAEQEEFRQAAAKAEQSVERSTREFSAYKRCMEDRISERQTVVCEIQSFSELKQRELRDKVDEIRKSKEELLSDISSALESLGNHFVECAGNLVVSFELQDTWQDTLVCVKSLVSSILDNEREQSSRLESKFHDALSELERAALDISDTTNALSETRNAMETLQRALSDKSELANGYCKERDDAQSRLVFMTGMLEEAGRDLEATRIHVAGHNDIQNQLQREVSNLKLRIEQLESKNAKLRDYIRKLTCKCEEWQQSWEQQSRIIHELRS